MFLGSSIPVTISPSLLDGVLHARHARRSMGHYQIGSPVEASLFVHSPSTGMETNEAGEGVGARLKGDCQSRGIQDSGFVNKYPGSSELDADVKDP